MEIDTAPKSPRALMEGGKWLVPVAERPANWREILDEPGVTVDVTHERVPAEADLVVRQSSDMENIQISATTAGAVPHMQERLLAWARKKRDLVRGEVEDLNKAHAQAVKSKWNPHALKRAVDKAVKRYNYYEKVVLAMEAGYCLFPTGTVDLFAVRTARANPDYQGFTGTRDEIGRLRQAKGQPLPAGEGRYVSNDLLVYQRAAKVTVKQWDQVSQQRVPQTVDGNEYFNKAFEDVEFPLDLAKPELMRITSEAMALKLFDEIGVLRVQRDDTAVAKGDPVILGRIIHPVGRDYNSARTRLTFFIGWYVDTRDL